MIVARQFIAWKYVQRRDPSRRDGMIGSDRRANDRDDWSTRGEDQTVPYGTEP
jgi:hypothetical protein